MSNIKAIAFDLGGVLMGESDYEFTPEEEILEKKFGIINFDKEYFDWAKDELDLPVAEIKKITKNLILSLYELRFPEVFQKYSKYKLATATNHISYITKWIKLAGISKYLYTKVNSSKIGFEKPNVRFYDILSQKLKEKPEEILFIDDIMENVQGAIDYGMHGIHHIHEHDLVEEIDNYIRLNSTII